ncbi:hypothetical protein ACOSP7_020448 [Xanthoceras sorbifolium]
MWLKLERVYLQQFLAKILQLHQQLQNIKKGSDSISDFVLKIKNIGDALMIAEEEVMEPCNVIGALISNFRDLILQILKVIKLSWLLNMLDLMSMIASHTMPTHQVKLNHILHVTSITKNLLSISKIIKDNDALVVFDLSTSDVTQLQSHICSKHSPHTIVHKASNVNVNTCNNRDTRLYSTAEPCHAFNYVVVAKKQFSYLVLHALYFSYNVNAPSFCDSCKLSKLHKLPFTRSEFQVMPLIFQEISERGRKKRRKKKKKKKRRRKRRKEEEKENKRSDVENDTCIGIPFHNKMGNPTVYNSASSPHWVPVLNNPVNFMILLKTGFGKSVKTDETLAKFLKIYSDHFQKPAIVPSSTVALSTAAPFISSPYANSITEWYLQA